MLDLGQRGRNLWNGQMSYLIVSVDDSQKYRLIWHKTWHLSAFE